jgi:geranylgeranyl pyrophosphate synthase
VVYGEASALLAGDALQARAFEVAAGNAAVPPELGMVALGRLARAAGSYGMVGGQTLDLRGEKEAFSREMLEKLHGMKTGAMIRVSAELGCLAAGIGPEDRRFAAAGRYAERIGLAFQVVDDLLDATSDAQTLGKSVGGDAALHKTTFLTFLSPDGARELAGRLTQEAVEALDGFAGNETLVELAWYLAEREV